MINMFTIIGRLKDKPKIELKGKMDIELIVPRSFKNINGEYDNDIIKVRLWNPISTTTQEYCERGDLMGVKGRIQINDNEMVLIAEKVTFLSNKKE